MGTKALESEQTLPSPPTNNPQALPTPPQFTMAELAKIRALCTGANPNDTLVAEAAAAVQAKEFQEALDKILQLPDDAPQKLDFQAQNIYCVCLWQTDQLEEALNAFNTLVEDFPDKEEPVINRDKVRRSSALESGSS